MEKQSVRSDKDHQSQERRSMATAGSKSAQKRLPGNDKSGPYIITGPVVGMVTDNSARILIETSIDSSVRCFLTTPKGRQICVEKKFQGLHPSAFSFENLEAGTTYKVTFNVPVPGLVKSKFHTMPELWDISKDAARVAFVSCNKYKITRDEVSEQTDLWKDLYKKASHGEIDYIIHMGDNVYLDTDTPSASEEEHLNGENKQCRWDTAVEMMQDIPRSQWGDYFEEVCELFRKVYRETWNHPPTKHALANVANLMILDDHEIRDDWGDREEDGDPTSLHYFLGCCAYEVYNEYQRNLFEDYEKGRTAHDSCRVGQAYHFHVFGEVGFMMIDARAAKTFHRNFEDPSKDEEFPMLGHAQWDDIKTALAGEGYFSSTRMLFVVSSMPLCYIGEGPNMAAARYGGKYFDDLYGTWSASEHVAEGSLLLSALFDWRAKHAGLREVCVVAGDVHQGGFTDIIDLRYMALNDTRLDRMKQLTASPVANKMVKPVQHAALNAARAVVNNLGRWHHFHHYNWTSNRNFLVVEASSADEPRETLDGTADTVFQFQLFTAHHSTKHRSKMLDSSHRAFNLIGGLAAGCSALSMGDEDSRPVRSRLALSKYSEDATSIYGSGTGSVRSSILGSSRYSSIHSRA